MTFLPDLPEEDTPRPIGPLAELDGFGRWRASSWVVPTASDVAYKRIVWDGSVVSAVTGKALDVSYYFESAMPTRELVAAKTVQEDYEAEAWAQLNEWVGRTARGTAFVPPVGLVGEIAGAVLEEIERWEALKPDEWRDRVVRAIRLAEQGTRDAERRLEAMGGDPESPLNTAAGWAVAVVPWAGAERQPTQRARAPVAPPPGG